MFRCCDSKAQTLRSLGPPTAIIIFSGDIKLISHSNIVSIEYNIRFKFLEIETKKYSDAKNISAVSGNWNFSLDKMP